MRQAKAEPILARWWFEQQLETSGTIPNPRVRPRALAAQQSQQRSPGLAPPAFSCFILSVTLRGSSPSFPAPELAAV